jgi:hypothetical protein
MKYGADIDCPMRCSNIALLDEVIALLVTELNAQKRR